MARQALLWFALAGLVVGAAADEPSRPLGLADLIAIAEASNPSLRAATARQDVAANWLVEAGAGENPRIGVGFDGLSAREPSRLMIGVSASQRVLLGGKVGARRAEAAEVVRLAEAEAAMQRLRVEHGVKRHYFLTLGASREVRLRRELLALAKATAQSLGARRPSDSGPALQAALATQQAALELASAERRHQARWHDLAAALGRLDLVDHPLVDALPDDLPALDYHDLTADFFESPEQVVMWSPLEQALLAAARARAEAVPDLDLTLRLGYDTRRPGARSMGWVAGFEVSMPLPIRDRNLGEREAYEALARQAAADAYRRDQALLAEFNQAWETYEDARQRLKSLRQELIPAARQAYQVAAAREATEAADWLELLNAQRLWSEAQLAEIAALTTGHDAAVQLQAAFLNDSLAAVGVNR